jgi:hypothetical protein
MGRGPFRCKRLPAFWCTSFSWARSSSSSPPSPPAAAATSTRGRVQPAAPRPPPMAVRLGLLQHPVLLSSASSASRALALSPARLPYPPNFPTCNCSASAAAPPRLRPRCALLTTRAMSSSGTAGNPYAAELAAAKKAVTLAARLCQVPVTIVWLWDRLGCG